MNLIKNLRTSIIFITVLFACDISDNALNNQLLDLNNDLILINSLNSNINIDTYSSDLSNIYISKNEYMQIQVKSSEGKHSLFFIYFESKKAIDLKHFSTIYFEKDIHISVTDTNHNSMINREIETEIYYKLENETNFHFILETNLSKLLEEKLKVFFKIKIKVVSGNTGMRTFVPNRMTYQFNKLAILGKF